MKISIAMATFNGASYILEQLESFAKQSRTPDELVVVDDCSFDDTRRIVERFSETVEFSVRLVSNVDRLGYTKNFEKAMSLCKGDIIFLSDQDDVWLPNKIQKIFGMFAADNNIFVIQANMIIADRDMNPSSFTQLGNTISLGGKADDFVTGCGLVMRRSWLQLALPIPGGIEGHDLWINRLATTMRVRKLVESPMQYYRRHETNESHAIASMPKRMSQMDSFRLHGLSNATKGWRRELHYYQAIHKRLAESNETLARLGLAGQSKSALLGVGCRVSALEQRIRNAELSRIRRFAGVLSMAWSGKYHHFSGWKSVVKDVLRP